MNTFVLPKVFGDEPFEKLQALTRVLKAKAAELESSNLMIMRRIRVITAKEAPVLAANAESNRLYLAFAEKGEQAISNLENPELALQRLQALAECEHQLVSSLPPPPDELTRCVQLKLLTTFADIVSILVSPGKFPDPV